jgi:hypothetical protein
MRRALAVGFMALLGAIGLLHAQMNPLSGTWQGELHFAQGAPMRMILVITEQNATLGAKVHVSDQGPKFLSVDPISRSGQVLNFEIKKLNGRFTGTISGFQIKGTFTQSGTNIPLTLTRTTVPRLN